MDGPEQAVGESPLDRLSPADIDTPAPDQQIELAPAPDRYALPPTSPEATLLQLGLHALYVHFSSAQYMLDEYLVKWDSDVLSTVLKKTARLADVR